MKLIAGLIAFSAALTAAETPRLSIGMLADIQYADKDTAGRRDYRASKGKLEACVAAMNREQVKFVIELGDLVDGDRENLDRILPVFNRFAAPKYQVTGNHDMGLVSGGRRAFEFGDWHFIVLDGMEVNAKTPAGRRELAQLRAARAPNAQEWNGALGFEQRVWLKNRLHDATAVGERAIVFCHFPVLPESSSPQHVLWDYRETLEIIRGEPATVAWFAGHDHRGGYAGRDGTHYVTLKGMVESSVEESCQVVDVYADRLVLRSAGATRGRTLRIPAK